MHNLAYGGDGLGGDSDPDWGMIAGVAKQSNPPCAPWMDSLVTFVKKGPSNAEILKDIDSALKIFGRSTAVLGSLAASSGQS